MVLRRVVMSQPHQNESPRLPAQTSTPPQPTTQQLLPISNPVTSYWLSEPHQYANLRSTPALPEKCDIAIIGSGMSGVLTAYHILKSRPATSIVLFDARQLCSGATARNGGHAKVKTDTLTSLPDDKTRSEFQVFVFGVINALKEIVEDEDLAAHCEFELRRSFDVFQDQERAEKVKNIYHNARQAGEAWTRNIAYLGKDMAERVTSIRGAVAAFSVPCASFWPYKLVTGLLERMIQRYPAHLNIQTNTPVTRIHQHNILGTPRGTLQAKKIVFATNAYTAGLLPSFAGTITPVRGMASHHTPASPIFPHLNNTYNIHFDPLSSNGRTGTDYLNPRPDSSIVVGGGAYKFRSDKESWWNNFDDSVRFPQGVEKHWEKYMQDTFLGWDGSGTVAESVWVGIQGFTGDGMMHMGRVPGEGEDGWKRQQWMLAGFNGGGMALIATAAKAVAKMVLEDVDFGDVREEFGLLEGFGTGAGRLNGGK